MSIYSSNYRDRLDISYILYNVQKALVNTRISKYVHTDILPCGEQAVVAIACYTGHNQDDSIVFNQSSIERGLFRSISLKKHVKKIEKNQSTSQDDIFMKPDQSKLTGARHAVYDKLNDKGYVPEETHIENGDVIIGKVTPIQPAPGSNKCFKDSSEIYKSSETAIIDRVFTGIYDSEGNEMIKIRTRSERIPKIGDKFCFSQDVLVLTTDGWKNISQITKNDLIANLYDDTIKYENPIDVYKFNYTGDIYHLTSNEVDLDVTIDHELYVKLNDSFELVEAAKVFQTDCVYKSFDFETNQNYEIKPTNKHEEIHKFTGSVYCLEVPSHVFMIRQNNKNVWIGNCSRHGQKGTIGLTLSQSNMPFSEEGISPDLIINPQGIPSRMCVGHLLECLFGKAGAIKGMEVDGTSFNEIDIEKIKDILEEHGYERNATEYLYNGMTGQKMHVPIYIGPTYYQRLKHLVMDKMHCLTGEHEVLTENGWINIKNITTNIKVLTLKDNQEIFDYPIEIHKYENSNHTKTLYHIKNDNIDTIMTEEHRVFVDDKLIKVNKLDRVSNITYTWKTRTNTFRVNPTTDLKIYESVDSVYCLTVPSEIFYVRRNGKEFWTGNSRARGPITMLTHQPPEGEIYAHVYV